MLIFTCICVSCIVYVFDMLCMLYASPSIWVKVPFLASIFVVDAIVMVNDAIGDLELVQSDSR